MRMRWCWKCKREVAMLTAPEMDLVLKAGRSGLEFVHKEAERRQIEFKPQPLYPELKNRELLAIVEMYRLLTGITEHDVESIFHHQLDLFGPDCPQCKKPLRTAQAKYCVACGFGKSDLDTDLRPLVEKRPDLF